MKTMDCRVMIETHVWVDVNIAVREDGTIDEGHEEVRGRSQWIHRHFLGEHEVYGSGIRRHNRGVIQ